MTKKQITEHYFGKIKISNNFGLAPMVDIGNIAFRELISNIYPPGIFFSEMLNVRILNSEKINKSDYYTLGNIEVPTVFQLVGNDLERFAKALEKLKADGIKAIDLNMGCSLTHIVKHGWGVALMKDILFSEKLVKFIRANWSENFSVKIRIGFDFDKNYLKDFALMLQESGVDVITLHPRIKSDILRKKSKWEYIAFLKEILKIPVWGNGDVFDKNDANKMFEETNCDGILIGRAAIIKPWIFKELVEENIENIDIYYKAKIILNYYNLLKKYFTGKKFLKRIDEFSHWYSKNFLFGHLLWTKIHNSKNEDEVLINIKKYFEKVEKINVE